jgi:hypothetical protein
MLTTNQKGAIAETAVAHAAVKRGIDVYRPVAEGGRCDLVFDVGRLLRVQCKWAPRIGDTVVVRCYSSRRTAGGIARRKYADGEIDAIAVYCPDNGHCYFIPASLASERAEVTLRLRIARNNQAARIHWAADYALEALDWKSFPGP